MATPTFDNYYARAKAKYPAADDASIRAAYQQKYGGDAVLTAGPSFEQYATRARAKYGAVDDDMLETAYEQKYGAPVGTELKRGLKRGLGQLMDFALNVVNRGDLDKTQTAVRDFVGDQSRSRQLADAPWYDPEKIATGVTEAAPSMAPGLIGGGVTSIGLRALGASPRVAVGGGALVGGGLGGAQEGLGLYDERIAAGIPEDQAAREATMYGLGSTALNTIPLARIFGRAPGRLKTGLSEALTEIAEEPTAALITGQGPIAATIEGAKEIGPASFLLGAAFGAGGRRRGEAKSAEQQEFERRLAEQGQQPQPAAPQESLEGVTERAAETRTLDAMLERRLRTEADVGADTQAAQSVSSPAKDAEALRVEAQLARRGVPTEAQLNADVANLGDPFAGTDRTPAPTLQNLLTQEPIRKALAQMREVTGWEETGGRLIRKPQYEGDPNPPVVGRTVWVPRAEWWAERPKGLTEAEAKAAIDKALAGETLGTRQSELVRFMVDVATEQAQLRSYVPDTIELDPDLAADINTATAYEIAYVARAAELAPEAVERAAIQYENDPDGFLKAVRQITRDASPDAQRGEAGARAQEAGAGAEGGALPGEALGVAEPAYHGSRHKFDRFSTEHIGSGEGNRAFGWGLYFAQNPKTARTYRTAGAASYQDNRVAEMVYRAFEATQSDEAAKRWLARRAKDAPAEFRQLYNDAQNNYDQIKRDGHLYEVDIPSGEIAKLLDLDAPLRRQPKAVQQVAREFLKRQRYLRADENGPTQLTRAWRAFLVDRGGMSEKDSGHALYSALAYDLSSAPGYNNGDRLASELLRSKGVPGSKYLDQGSRDYMDGKRATHNLVLFDENLATITKVEDPKHAYRGAVGVASGDERQAAFNFETRPDTEAEQVRLGQAALRDFVAWRDRRAGVSVLGSSIPRDFRASGNVSLVGREVKTLEDVAALAQVYRDPRFETLRFIFTKADRVVYHYGVTSRLPGVVQFGVGVDAVGGVASAKRESGADGYYIIHNHPSGRAMPSSADIRMTAHIQTQVPGFQGHVVVDNDEYGVIDLDGEVATRHAKFGGYSTERNPTIPHDLLGNVITSTTDLAKTAKRLEARDGFTTLVFIDSVSRTRALVEYPTKLLTSSTGRLNSTAVARVTRASRASGGRHVFAVTDDLEGLSHLLSSGVIKDAIATSGPMQGRKFSDTGMLSETNLIEQRRKSYPVAEPEATYRTAAADGSMAGARSAERPGRVEAGGGSYSMKQFGGLSDAELSTLTRVMQNMEAPIERQRRGTRSWNATEEAALKLLQDRFGVTLDSLVNRKLGSTANAELLEAYGSILAKGSQEMQALAERAATTGSNEDLAQLASARERLGLLIAPAMGYRTEAGRALNILRKTAADFKTADKLMDALGDGSRSTLLDFAKRVRQAGNLDQVIGITRESYTPDWLDKLIEYRTSMGLLSGPTTHSVNIVSNALFNLLELGARGIVSATTKHYPAAALRARLAATTHGAMVGLTNAKRAFLTEEPQLTPQTQVDLARHRAIGGKLGKAVRIPTRALMAEDEFFKAVAFHQHLADLAMQEAIAAKPKDVQAKFNEIMGDVLNRPQMVDAAREAADRATFQDPLGPLAGMLAGMSSKGMGRLLRLIIPFIRTPVNILKRAVEYTPAGYSMQAVRDAIKAGGQDQALAVARMGIGSSLMLGTMGLAAKGILSGAGPDDENERRLLMRTGWQPYSVRAGDRWYRFNRFEPTGMLLGVAADLFEIGSYASEGELDQIGSMLMTSIALNLGDKTFLRGVTDFTQAYSEPKRYFARWAEGMVGSMVPNVAAQTARGLDPYQREARGLLDTIRSRIPGQRERLATKLDIAGEPIQQTGDFPGNPVPGTQVRDDALAGTLLRLGLRKDKPDRSFHVGKLAVSLEGQDYESYVKFVQGARWRMLTPVVQSPQFKALMQENPQRATELLDRHWIDIGRDAKKAWVAQNPSVLLKSRAKPRVSIGSEYAEAISAGSL